MRENLVERLLKRAETRKRSRSQLYLLAAACTQIAHEEMKEDIRSRIERGLAEMVPLRSEEEVQAMTAAGPLAIPYLAPRFEYSSRTAAACVSALLQIGSEAALNALNDYTADDTFAVDVAFIMSLRNASDKAAYAQRFLSHIKSFSLLPSMIELLPFLSHLSSLELSHLPQVTDFSFLQHLFKLNSISIGGLARKTTFPQHVLKRVRITRLD